jgi:hypothetical protein
MAALRELLVSFGIEVNTKPLTDAEQKTNDLADKLGKVAGAVAAAFALDKVKDFVLGMVGAADAVGDQAARLNLSSKALEEWTYAAKFADLEAGELNGVFDKLARTSVAAGEAGSEQSKKLKELGVDVKDVNGNFKDTSSLFEEVGLALAGVDDETKRTALSFEFFGKTAGPKVLQLFKEGPAGIAKFRAEFEELGGGFGDFVEEAGAVDDQMHRLDLAWTSAKTKIAGLLLPAVLTLTQGMTRAVAFFTKLAKESNLVQAALVTLGAVAVGLGFKVLVAWGPAILATAAWAAAIALVVLAVEDLITFFQGGDSLIGRLIDEWFGPGAQDKVRQWTQEVYAAFAGFMNGTFEVALGVVLSVLSLIGWAFSDNEEASDKFAASFLKHAAVVTDAIDSILSKLQALKDLIPTSFGDALDTFVTGANDALDVAEGALGKLGLETRTGRDAAAGVAGAKPEPITAEGVRNAFAPPGQATAPAGGGGFFGGAPVTVEAPITNHFTLPPGTPAGTARAAADAANKGSAAGVNRAAAAAFDKRGRK